MRGRFGRSCAACAAVLVLLAGCAGRDGREVSVGGSGDGGERAGLDAGDGSSGDPDEPADEEPGDEEPGEPADEEPTAGERAEHVRPASGAEARAFYASREATSRAVLDGQRLAGHSRLRKPEEPSSLTEIEPGTYEVDFEVTQSTNKLWSGWMTVDGVELPVRLHWVLDGAGEPTDAYSCIDTACETDVSSEAWTNEQRIGFLVFNYELLNLTTPGGHIEYDLPAMGPPQLAGRGRDGSTVWNFVWFGTVPASATSLVSAEGCELSLARVSRGVFRSTQLALPACGEGRLLAEEEVPPLDGAIAYLPADAERLLLAPHHLVERARAGGFTRDVAVHVSEVLRREYLLPAGDWTAHVDLAPAEGTVWRGSAAVNGGPAVAVELDVADPDVPSVCLDGACADRRSDEQVVLHTVLVDVGRLLGASHPTTVGRPPILAEGIRLAHRSTDGTLLWSNVREYEGRWLAAWLTEVEVISPEGCETTSLSRFDDGGSVLRRDRVPGCGQASAVTEAELFAAADAYPYPI